MNYVLNLELQSIDPSSSHSTDRLPGGAIMYNWIIKSCDIYRDYILFLLSLPF